MPTTPETHHAPGDVYSEPAHILHLTDGDAPVAVYHPESCPDPETCGTAWLVHEDPFELAARPRGLHLVRATFEVGGWATGDAVYEHDAYLELIETGDRW